MPKFQHMELSTDDPEGAKRFYGQLFGWKFKDMPFEGGTYSMVFSEGEGIGGVTPKMMPQQPTGWLGYISVKSADKSIAKAKELGAHVIMDRTEIPNMGVFAIFTDPTGGPFAIWESLAPPPPKPAKKAAKKKAAKKAAKKKAAPKKAAKKSAPKKKAAKKKKR